MRTAKFAIAALLVTGSVAANAITFSASQGNLAAQAEFTLVGNNLQVVLSNVSTFDTIMPTDVLTGVFFNITGVSSLTPLSAVVSSGSSVYNNTTLVYGQGTDIGGAWAYKSGIPPVSGANQGISAAGLGLFGDADVFPGNNVDNVSGVDGLNYGMLSAGDDLSTRNGGLSGRDLTQYSTTFLLSGLPQNFDLSSINTVSLQYGTDLSETRLVTPEPCSLLALGALLAFRRRRTK